MSSSAHLLVPLPPIHPHLFLSLFFISFSPSFSVFLFFFFCSSFFSCSLMFCRSPAVRLISPVSMALVVVVVRRGVGQKHCQAVTSRRCELNLVYISFLTKIKPKISKETSWEEKNIYMLRHSHLCLVLMEWLAFSTLSPFIFINNT